MSVSTFLHSVSVLLPVLFVMALGFGAGRAREFNREQLDGLTELVLKYALPAMLFVGVAPKFNVLTRHEFEPLGDNSHIVGDPNVIQMGIVRISTGKSACRK